MLFNNTKIKILLLIAYCFPTLLEIINFIIFKKGKDIRFIYAHKSFIKNYNFIIKSILNGIVEIAVMPHKAYIISLAIIKSVYRMNISKKHLLEWLTADQAEKQAKTDLLSSYKFMIINLVLGIWYFIVGIVFKKYFEVVLGFLWIIAPIITWYISKDIKKVKPIEQITKQDKEYLLNIARNIWQYFKDNINEDNNFLPPDNFQEDRKPKIARQNINNKYRIRFNCNNFCI